MIASRDFEAFRLAALNGRAEIVSKLLEEVDPARKQEMIAFRDFEAFRNAVERGHVEIVLKLLEEVDPAQKQAMIGSLQNPSPLIRIVTSPTLAGIAGFDAASIGNPRNRLAFQLLQSYHDHYSRNRAADEDDVSVCNRAKAAALRLTPIISITREPEREDIKTANQMVIAISQYFINQMIDKAAESYPDLSAQGLTTDQKLLMLYDHNLQIIEAISASLSLIRSHIKDNVAGFRDIYNTVAALSSSGGPADPSKRAPITEVHSDVISEIFVHLIPDVPKFSEQQYADNPFLRTCHQQMRTSLKNYGLTPDSASSKISKRDMRQQAREDTTPSAAVKNPEQVDFGLAGVAFCRG